MQYSIKTFGCKVNTYDSALIQKNLSEKGWQEKAFPGTVHSTKKSECSDETQLHIINTCAVTEEAVREARRWIRRYRKKHPHTRILVTGCAAQVETEQFTSLKEVDLVVANSDKHNLADIVHQIKTQPQKVFKSSIFKKTNLESGGSLESRHTRLFLKIQDGCDSFCTFCIIPFARGKSRSLSPEELVHSVNQHYEEGICEVVLTGIHIGDYRVPGKKEGLAYLVRTLLEKTQIPRIRLSSLEPIELSDELLELYSSNRMCPHFHLSIQSFHSEVLKSMKRKYSAQNVEDVLLKIHKQHDQAFVGMDIIAGFAEETQQQFEETYLRLRDCPWTKLHVFPYSPRRFTYAQKFLPSQPRSLILKRAALLRHLSEDRYRREAYKQIGLKKNVLPLLFARDRTSMQCKGVSRDFWTVEWFSSHKISYTNEDKHSRKARLIRQDNNVSRERHHSHELCSSHEERPFRKDRHPRKERHSRESGKSIYPNKSTTKQQRILFTNSVC